MKNFKALSIRYIIFLLTFSFSFISGCQWTSCSCGNGDSKSNVKTTQKIIPIDFILSQIQKNKIYLSNQNSESGTEEIYQIERGGRLFVTGSDVYYIKNGDVAWQSSPARKYQMLNNIYYVATGDYVFCAMKDGRVLWKTGLANSGSCVIKDGILFVLTANGVKKLDLKSGKGVL